MRRFFVLKLVGAIFLVCGPPAVCPGAVLSIGHRGNSLFAPENTLAAFAAAQGKADLVETDARLSADGKLVIMHDATVDRTTDGTGTVASKTVAQLKLLDAGSWFSAEFAGEPVPTLEEVITNTSSYATVLIERKDGPASAYVEELRRLGAMDEVIVQSFDWNFLAAVHALEPGLRLGALGSGTLNAANLNTIIQAGAGIVAWEKSTVTANEVQLVHNAGLALYVWTVDGAEIRNFIDLGVEGIISNDPGMVKELQQPGTNAPSQLGDGLVAYWKMDDGLADPFATVVADSQGANAGTLVRNDGASHWLGSPNSMFGGCLKLEGVNAYVTIPHTTSLDLNTNQMTFCAWVRLLGLPSQLTTSYGAIYDSTTDCYVLYLDKGNKELRFKITDVNGQAARPGIPEAFLPTNQWIHVAATFTGNASPGSGQATIYLNGQPKDVHTGNDGTAPVGLTGNVKTGQMAAMGREGPTGGNYFNGYVDDVVLWSRALSAAEVLQIYQGGQQGLSVGDLLAQGPSLLEIRSLRLVSDSTQLEIEFSSTGPSTTFRLLQSASVSGPFIPVAGLAPESIGEGVYRFTYTLTGDPQAFFWIEGSY